jgi:ribose/xylose/arabinose/galactoside ABC-type transport system permease subunit
LAAAPEHHRLDACPVKTWTFTTYTIAAFCCSGLAVLLLIVNAVTANQHLSLLLPIAVAALVIGGILSVRARLLRYRARDTTKR